MGVSEGSSVGINTAWPLIRSIQGVGVWLFKQGSNNEIDLSLRSVTGGTSTERMRILANGNVGIGTTSPSYTLDVSSFAVDGGTIRIASSSSCQFRMMEVNDTYGFSFTNVAASRMSIKRHSASSAGSEIISIMRDNPYVGIGTTNPGSALSFGAVINNKILTLYDGNAADPVSTATFFYGFGINGGTLRYQVPSTGDIHRFYCGATLAATIAETTATFNGRVVTPNVYYIMGYLAGGTTGGNYISLGVQQSSGGMAVTSSNKLVAPISGLYHFGFNTIMNTTTGRNDVNINVNGGSIVNTLSEDNGTGYHYRSGMITYYLNANDFVQFFCSSGTIYNLFNVDAWHTYFFYHVG
jgi:hypothetical protein